MQNEMNIFSRSTLLAVSAVLAVGLAGCGSMKYSKGGEFHEDIEKDLATCASLINEKYAKLAPAEDDLFVKMNFYFKTLSDRQKDESDCMTAKGYQERR
ncbi:MAG: hypothetical protein FGM18_09225 [Burkholderiaceae bacterium]|nr:hypothetical protein [Burkholderiaceae bacterium]